MKNAHRPVAALLFSSNAFSGERHPRGEPQLTCNLLVGVFLHHLVHDLQRVHDQVDDDLLYQYCIRDGVTVPYSGVSGVSSYIPEADITSMEGSSRPWTLEPKSIQAALTQ